MARGGKREGAGRKSGGELRAKVTVQVKPRLLEALDALAEEQGLSRARMVENIIEVYMENSKEKLWRTTLSQDLTAAGIPTARHEATIHALAKLNDVDMDTARDAAITVAEAAYGHRKIRKEEEAAIDALLAFTNFPIKKLWRADDMWLVSPEDEATFATFMAANEQRK